MGLLYNALPGILKRVGFPVDIVRFVAGGSFIFRYWAISGDILQASRCSTIVADYHYAKGN